MKDFQGLMVPTYEDVVEAHARIAPHIHRTPVLTSSFLNELTGAELFFKCENFQKAGAFKVRGRAMPSSGCAIISWNAGSPRIRAGTMRCPCPMRRGGGGSPARW